MKKVFYILIFLAVITGCKKPFNPVVTSTETGYLVVEGLINSGSDSTFITLSHTVKLSGKTSTSPEVGATVTVESDQNTSYPLTGTGKGVYASAGLNLNNAHKYRLDIKTSSGKQYLSDFVEVVNSPPIDSVNYDTNGSPSAGPGLNVYANTHDASNKARYFRWDYQETWIFHSAFLSAYKSNGDTVLARDLVNDNINVCWRSDTSSTILLGSSAKLAQNVIINNPIISINSTSEKLGFEYSILVRQYALTGDAFDFYTNLKKNTEQLGSIFDAQPSQISGNIHAVNNPAEPVIGYISVGSTTSKRIFIFNRVLPAWVATPIYPDCVLLPDPTNPKSACCYYVFTDMYGNKANQVDKFINYNSFTYLPGGDDPLIPIAAITMARPPIGFTVATKECADCTLRGTNKMPTFWK
ncbi:MAG TPA: DUF4249 domain-containing protein [Mucilaginibacter sp.]